MANYIHFSEKDRQKLMDSFAVGSETDSLFSHDLDMEFSGVKTVHVTSLKTYELQNYDRSKAVGTGSRYGNTHEVGDSVQTFTMEEDKSLSLSVDKGNNAEQFNMKKAGKVMDAERKERIVPYLDTYRMAKWAESAGIHYELPAALTKTNIVTNLLELHNAMLEAGVPDKITLNIKRTYLPMLKLSSEWTALDSLGGKTLPSGCIGEFDGMAVKPMISKRFPANAAFVLTYKGSIIAPMKIKDFKGHVNPPGLSGDLLEFRMIHGAFVLGNKASGVAVGCEPGTVAKVPTIAVSSGKATITSTTADATIYYTLDGSDPRYSKEAKVYTAAVAVEAGDEVRAYAAKDGMWNSDATEVTVVD